MNTINQNLPIFKNLENQIISNTSNYENIKPKKKLNLYRLDIHNSKFYTNNLKIQIYVKAHQRKIYLKNTKNSVNKN